MTTRSTFDGPIITCVLTVSSQFSLCVPRMKVEGALYLKQQTTSQEHILGLWRYNFALLGAFASLRSTIKMGAKIPGDLVQFAMVTNFFEGGT